MKFEYKTLELNAGEKVGEFVLDDLGAAGWELAGLLPYKEYSHTNDRRFEDVYNPMVQLIFKRPLP